MVSIQFKSWKNDDIGHYFQTLKGLHQGDPLSPILFNIVAGMLAIIIGRAKNDGQIGSLVPHLIEGGISILQYADAIQSSSSNMILKRQPI